MSDDTYASQRSAHLRARSATGNAAAQMLDSNYSPREAELIRSTYSVLARIGARQLSLRKVAEEAGVSAALLVYHFGSKDNLLLETMRWVLSRTVRRFKEGFLTISDPEKALDDFVRTIFIGPQANRDFYLVYLDLIEYGARNPSFQGLTELLRVHSNESFAFVIGKGVEAGVFDVGDVSGAATHARALVEGFFIQWLQDPDWRRKHVLVREECHGALLDLLRGKSKGVHVGDDGRRAD